ncbi:alpha/beta hydrolase [Pseudorhodoplanes sp.]|uniref:alpha/beta hydrolase n=1 Tax=Pseudorhodoplanes sp. TaxID=1934341 RepID=UPI00391AF08C
MIRTGPGIMYFGRLNLVMGLFVALAAMMAAGSSLAQQHGLAGFGIVLIHGKGGTPTTGIEGLHEALKRQGALVEAPEMPWSARRIYDATFDDAMTEIDAAAERLKKAGATRIAVVGHSLGANAAIGYAARRKDLHAVVALAPGHLPEAWALRMRTGGAIARARKMIAAGQGDVRVSFPDLAQGIPFSVQATARVYLSMFDPDGPAVMPKNAAAMGSVPFLWVAGVADPIVLHGKDYIFGRAPKHPKSKYLVTASMHLSTPFQARGQIVEWLRGL